MTEDQQQQYDRLTSVHERAAFLLGIGVTAILEEITDEGLVYRAQVGDMALSITSATRCTAVKKATAYLQEKAADNSM